MLDIDDKIKRLVTYLKTLRVGSDELFALATVFEENKGRHL